MNFTYSKRVIFYKVRDYSLKKQPAVIVPTVYGKVDISDPLYGLKRIINKSFVNFQDFKEYFKSWETKIGLPNEVFSLKAQSLLLVSPLEELVVQVQKDQPEAVFFNAVGNPLGTYNASSLYNIQTEIEKYSRKF